MIGTMNSRAYWSDGRYLDRTDKTSSWPGSARQRTTHLGFKSVRHYTFIQHDHPMQGTKSRRNHGFFIFLFCIVACPVPSRAFNARPFVIHVNSVHLSLGCGWVLGAKPARRIQFLTKSHNEAVQVRYIRISIAPNSFPQVSVRLFRKLICCLIG